MTTKLAPYGDPQCAGILSKVGFPGKNITPRSLVSRMPSLDIASKVGLPPMPKMPTPESLVSRMPSADVAAKVGGDKGAKCRAMRVIRKNAAI